MEVCPVGGRQRDAGEHRVRGDGISPAGGKEGRAVCAQRLHRHGDLSTGFLAGIAGAKARTGGADRPQHQPDGQQQHLRAHAVFDLCGGAAGRSVPDFAGRDAQNHGGRRAGSAGGADGISG